MNEANLQESLFWLNLPNLKMVRDTIWVVFSSLRPNLIKLAADYVLFWSKFTDLKSINARLALCKW